MTKQVEKRLTDLEAASKPVKGLVVLYADDSDTGAYWDRPIYDSDRRRISEDKKRELEAGYSDLFVVRYVKDWRERSGAT